MADQVVEKKEVVQKETPRDTVVIHDNDRQDRGSNVGIIIAIIIIVLLLLLIFGRGLFSGGGGGGSTTPTTNNGSVLDGVARINQGL